MLKFTKQTLKKAELLLEDVGYIVRYEKGNFQSGYCLLQDRKVVIVNKFFETEARINALLDIIQAVEINAELLSDKSRKFYKRIQPTEKEE
ncbi:MAG: hypothetical protein AAGI23_06030 [Bacteroidota bacterium]